MYRRANSSRRGHFLGLSNGLTASLDSSIVERADADINTSADAELRPGIAEPTGKVDSLDKVGGLLKLLQGPMCFWLLVKAFVTNRCSETTFNKFAMSSLKLFCPASNDSSVDSNTWR